MVTPPRECAAAWLGPFRREADGVGRYGEWATTMRLSRSSHWGFRNSAATALQERMSKTIVEPFSRDITQRQIEVAKRLLTTTDWRIKRIAFETSDANPNRFIQLFRTETGMTPVEYRAHRPGGGAPVSPSDLPSFAMDAGRPLQCVDITVP